MIFFTTSTFITKGQNFEEINLTKAAGDDRHPFFSPDGKTIVFESNRDGNWEIYIMDSNGDNQKKLTNNPADDRMPSWHPAENKILFQSDRNGKIELFHRNRF